jgi:arabinose-5-phosphate isomerase
MIVNKILNNDVESAKRTINKEIETLNVMKENLNDSLSKSLDLMQKTKGRIILTGVGKSGHICRKIAASLTSIGSPSFFIHPAEASHGDLGMITYDDIVIAISNSGESKELLDILNYSK